MKCSEGECVQDYIIERRSAECGYIPKHFGDVSEAEYRVFPRFFLSEEVMCNEDSPKISARTILVIGLIFIFCFLNMPFQYIHLRHLVLGYPS